MSKASLPVGEMIGRLEKLTGPDREMDALIWCVEAPRMADILPHWTDEQRENMVPRFTASLDAAVALVEMMLPGHGRVGAKGRMTPGEPMYAYQIFASDLVPEGEDPVPVSEAEHNIEPIALLIALLRSLPRWDGR